MIISQQRSYIFLLTFYTKSTITASRLQKICTEADTDIAKLQELRKTLVEKNLSGVHSDEIFKEQNAMIEDKVIRAQITKDDFKLNKYNI